MQPNILMIVLDSLRMDHVGLHHEGTSLTPNIDEFAEQAVFFQQTISQGSSTPPSVKAMMSSTYPNELDGPSSYLSEIRPIIPRYLREAGYCTAGITPNEYLSSARGWSRDFTYYDDCDRLKEYRRLIWFRGLNQILKRVGIPLELPATLPAETLYQRAGTWLKHTERPFFLWIQTMDVHWPYRIQRFSPNPVWQQRQRYERLKIRPRLISEAPQFNNEEHKHLLELYRNAVRYSDAQLGSFLKGLSRDGVLDNTVVIILSDHGEEFGEHRRYFHSAHLYDVLVHVPLLIHLPNHLRPKNRTYPHQVRLIDIGPTLLELAGIALPQHLRGSSLLPILLGESEKDRPAFIETFTGQNYAIRVDGWKYFLDTQTGQSELYHLDTDPGEIRSCLEEHPEVASELHTRLEDHIAEIKQAQPPVSVAVDEDPEVLNRLRDLGYVE